MTVALTTACIVILLGAFLLKRASDRHEIERHRIAPEALHT